MTFKLLTKRLISKPVTKMTVIISIGMNLFGCAEGKIDEQTLHKVYAYPVENTNQPLQVYHLGHSLVARDMPNMLMQLAGEGHDYRSQLGWGATLKSHWEPDVPINGFKQENSHPYYQDVFEAINSKWCDAIVLTEMVEIKDAIKYYDSARYFTNFVRYIHEKVPKSRIYLYESWHGIDDEFGWINRLDRDYEKYWLQEILDKALLKTRGNIPVYVIPVGQVMSHFFKHLDTLGGIDGLANYEGIFAKTDDGKLDPIHINDVGAYLVALVHYAVLYQKSPEGLPYQLKRADGSNAIAPSEEAARLMQKVTWEVVSMNYRTGLKGLK